MSKILSADEKLEKQMAINSLTIKVSEYFSGRYDTRCVSDDGGQLLEVLVETLEPSLKLLEQHPDFPIEEVVPVWGGWRVVILKVPIGYIDSITL